MSLTPSSPMRRRQRYQLRRRRYQPLDMAAAPISEPLPAMSAGSAEQGQEVEDLRDRLMRQQAEHENHRKRLDRVTDERVKFALEGLLTEILPVIDNFERAVSHAGDNPEVIAFAKGMELTHRQLLDTLGKQGLEKIPALGQAFDPHIHEAMGAEKADGVEEGTILEVIQEGYRLHDRVVRPALVKVAR